MTNAEIIFRNRVFLMEEGVIDATDDVVTFSDENGTREVHVPEEIHTFQAWKKLGYVVNKGEHAVAKFPIWKFKIKKKKGEDDDDEERSPETGSCFMKVAFFFTEKQVSKI